MRNFKELKIWQKGIDYCGENISVRGNFTDAGQICNCPANDKGKRFYFLKYCGRE